MTASPFIVTAELPGNVLAWADALRRAYFPPERNHLAAHVTMFHAFSPSLREELQGMLAALADEFAPPAVRVTGLMNLGGGTAIKLHSPGMSAIRTLISERFHGMLTAQDQGAKQLHITIQNKVAPAAAKALQTALAPVLESREFAFPALGLHLYLGPQWEPQGRWPLRGRAPG